MPFLFFHETVCSDGRTDSSGFGHKAGYLPPPQSIKAQVMSGTLLSTANEPVAPPPFSPKLAVKVGASSSGSSSSSSSSSASAPAPAPAPAAVPSPAVDASSSGDSPALADPPKDPPALPAPGKQTPYAKRASDSSVQTFSFLRRYLLSRCASVIRSRHEYDEC